MEGIGCILALIIMTIIAFAPFIILFFVIFAIIKYFVKKKKQQK